tara:strand:- start:805 stop:1248 length:444 start_codon:yes stop_codon:yes gene_type:complete
MILFILIFLLFSNTHAYAENEIGFQRFKELIDQNVDQQLAIIEQDPLNAESYFNLGLEYMSLGKTELEIKAYLEAIHLYGNYSKVHFNLAIAYDREKKGEKAVKHLLKAEQITRKQKNPAAVRRVQRTLKLYYQKYRKTSKDQFIQR